MFGGAIFALLAGLGAAGSLLTGVTPTKWPHPPIRLDETPDQFWGRVRLYVWIAVFGMTAFAIGLVIRFV
jgi:hypothetical protein